MFSQPDANSRGKKALLASGALRIAGQVRPPSAAILMYHSVVQDPRAFSDTLGDICHDEKSFHAQMELVARDYRPISLDDLVGRLLAGEPLPRRSVAITFDDGYADNFEVAMPVLDRVGIPATFYVTVDCIESRTLPWPARLRYAFSKAPTADMVETAKAWDIAHPARESSFTEVCETAARIGFKHREMLLDRGIEAMGVDPPPQQGAMMMTQEQLRTLVNRGQSIGSHTMTHPNLAHIEEQEVGWELSESKRKLEAMLNSPVRHFAYPCPALSPHWNDRTISQCSDAGYESAITTDHGVVKRGGNPLCLPRIRPTKTVEGLRWNLECAFAGRAAT